jgi:hypothetical protein
MARHSRNTLIFTVLMGSGAWLASPVAGQDEPAEPPNAAAEQSPAAARREIIESDRWRRMNRALNEWLSVQTIYSDEQATAMITEIQTRIRTMSPREVEDFMEDMEERLAVLLSPEAEDAREWLNQFLAVAANPEGQLGRPLPDVANMTASQIRQEIRWLQQHRDDRQRAHAAGVQSRQSQAARQPTRPQTPDRSSWPAHNQTRPSRYAPQPELRPQPLTVSPYVVSPWGTPIIFNPLSDRW